MDDCAVDPEWQGIGHRCFGLTDADEFGGDLLARMTGSGACLTAAPPPKSEELLRSSGLSVVAPRAQCARAKVLRFWRFTGSRMNPW